MTWKRQEILRAGQALFLERGARVVQILGTSYMDAEFVSRQRD